MPYPSPLPLPTLTTTPTRHPDCCLSLSTTLLSLITHHSRSRSNTTKTILSIGSGSGLLEALLNSYISSSSSRSSPLDIVVEGVEVHQQQQQSSSSSLNRYLAEPHTSTVRGTWELSSRALLSVEDENGDEGKEEIVLMFVYPRKPDLVRRYVEGVVRRNVKKGNGDREGVEEQNGKKRGVRKVIWLGPQADWEDFKGCFLSGNTADGTAGAEGNNGVEDLLLLVGEGAGLAGYEMMAVVSF